jgi:hypothetical protein
MVTGQLVVAIGQHEDGRHVGDPAGHELQHVQSGVVGPVDILDGQYRRTLWPVQLTSQCIDDPPPVARLECSAQRRPDTSEQVAQRSQHPWRGQVVAVADEKSSFRRQYRTNRLHETGLADAGLTDDQHDRAVPADRCPRGRGQLRELSLTFEDRPAHLTDCCSPPRR